MMDNEKLKRSCQSSCGSTKSSLPRSAPSMIPKRVKVKENVRVESEPSIIHQKETKDLEALVLDKTKSKNTISEISKFTVGSSHFLSDLEISCSKNISCGNVTQRNVGTNYSVNDFCEYFYSLHILKNYSNENLSSGAPSESFCSIKLKKRRWKLFCC